VSARARRLAAAASLLVCCACGAENADPARAGAAARPLVRADPSPGGGPDDAVVLVRATTQGEQICTGTLLAPRLVVTSRHCVAYTGPDDFQCTVEGELVQNPNGGGTLGADFRPGDVEIYAGPIAGLEPAALGANIVSSLSNSICQNDIAFVVLDRALELPSAPLRIRVPTRRGELVRLVGFGSDGTPDDLPWSERPRRRLDQQTVADVGPDSIADGVTNTRPRTLVFDGPSSCFGDSGGPALSETTDAVIGVFSILDRSDCLDPDVLLFYTHTSPFEGLAREAFALAEADPVFEDDRRLGEACDVDHQCASGRCTRPAEPAVCSETCAGGACPAGFACSTALGEPLCLPETACLDCAPGDQGPRDSGCGLSSPGSASRTPAPAALVLASWLGLAVYRRRRLTTGTSSCSTNPCRRNRPWSARASS
jgi:hypothetical protein